MLDKEEILIDHLQAVEVAQVVEMVQDLEQVLVLVLEDVLLRWKRGA